MTVQNKKGILYSKDQTPPTSSLFFSSLQHMVVVLSLGLALPIIVARESALNVEDSARLLAATLFMMGVISILQSSKIRHLGTGYQSFSVTESSALFACVMAAQLGGIPLVCGMTLFSGLLKIGLSSIIYKIRKFFPPEVTGTMIFILGISIIPTALRNFLGAEAFAATGVNTPHMIVACLSFLSMFICGVFFPKLRQYAVLLGTAIGYALSVAFGLIGGVQLASLADTPAFSLPIYNAFSLAFDARAIIPFLVVTIASVIDNIGDFTAIQSTNDANFQKPDWRMIQTGMRGAGIGTAISALFGGMIQGTATANIGIAGATGITSRMVAYVGGAMMIVLAFIPKLTGFLSMIPSPVLGAILLYSVCFIMAGGFQTLASIEMDTRRTFLIFISIIMSISTLIPSLYAFLPEQVSTVLVSPVVMGAVMLLVLNLLVRIGRKQVISITAPVRSDAFPDTEKALDEAFKGWATPRVVSQKVKIGLSALCESIEDIDPDAIFKVDIAYNELQVKLDIVCERSNHEKALQNDADGTGLWDITQMMLSHLFESAKTTTVGGNLHITIKEDV